MKTICSAVICSLLIFSVQGQAVNDDEANERLLMKEQVRDHKKFLNEMKKWLTHMSQNMNEELARANDTLQLLPNALLEDRKAQVSMLYAEALQQFEALPAPQKCITAGQLELMQLRKPNLEGFSQCLNISSAMNDIGNMVTETGKLTAQLLATSDEILNGYSRCTTWNLIKYFSCTFNWVKDSVTDVYRTFKAISEYNRSMGLLITDFNERIRGCFKKSKTLALLHKFQVVDIINKCSA